MFGKFSCTGSQLRTVKVALKVMKKELASKKNSLCQSSKMQRQEKTDLVCELLSVFFFLILSPLWFMVGVHVLTGEFVVHLQ